jgi:zinc/manganese transport system ATP-binding protein
MISAIELDDLTLCHGNRPAVHHLSGRFEPGTMTGIVGPNGAGKSTLLQALAGLHKPRSGRLVTGAPRLTAYLPQQSDVDKTFPLSVLEVVSMGHWRRVGIFGGVNKALREEARETLNAVGLSGFEHRPIGTLSVGQFQRTLFARAMLEDCPIILMDEPFAALDERTTTDLLRIMHRWHTENRTLIAVLHDLDQVREHFPSSLLLARECLGWGETGSVLTPERLRAAKRMAEGWDENAELCEIGGGSDV